MWTSCCRRRAFRTSRSRGATSQPNRSSIGGSRVPELAARRGNRQLMRTGGKSGGRQTRKSRVPPGRNGRGLADNSKQRDQLRLGGTQTEKGRAPRSEERRVGKECRSRWSP